MQQDAEIGGRPEARIRIFFFLLGFLEHNTVHTISRVAIGSVVDHVGVLRGRGASHTSTHTSHAYTFTHAVDPTHTQGLSSKCLYLVVVVFVRVGSTYMLIILFLTTGRRVETMFKSAAS